MGCARRSVHLPLVMQLHDLAGAHVRGRPLRELHHEHSSQGEIGGHEDRRAGGAGAQGQVRQRLRS